MPAKLPADPKPIFFGDDATAQKETTKARSDPKYDEVWKPTQVEDLTLLLTGLSQLLSGLDERGQVAIDSALAESLRKRGLLDLAATLNGVFVNSGTLPPDFVERVQQHLKTIRKRPRLGVWSPKRDDLAMHDFSALAAWMNRTEAAYFREDRGVR